jgi:hypothetical protein
VAFVSLVIALAVAVPVDEAPKAVAENDSVATAVPGVVTVEGEIRNTSLPLAPIRAVTASVAAFRAAVEWVTAICKLLQFSFAEEPDQIVLLNFASLLAGDLHFEMKLTDLPL